MQLRIKLHRTKKKCYRFKYFISTLYVRYYESFRRTQGSKFGRPAHTQGKGLCLMEYDEKGRG